MRLRLPGRNRRARLRPKDIVGVPLMPPARVTASTTRLRSALLALHRRAAPAPLQIIESVLGILDNTALVAFCELGVPDRLEHATDIEELAAILRVQPDALARLVRFSAARGWVKLTRKGRVKPNRTTRFLRADHPGGWRAWVEFAGSAEVGAAARSLAAGMKAGQSGFARAHGAPFFEWMADHPDRHAVFDASMDAGARMHALALSTAVPWTNARQVCDVGGGSGALLAGLLAAHSHLHGVLLDLPDVVARAPRRDRLEIVAGDAFVEVPPGCDTYLLVNVLHDWGDDDCVRLLGRIVDRLGPRGRVIVVDGERSARPHDSVTTRTDLLMLVLTATGRERTTAEFAALGGLAGLRLDRALDLASGDRAYVFVRSDRAAATGAPTPA